MQVVTGKFRNQPLIQADTQRMTAAVIQRLQAATIRQLNGCPVTQFIQAVAHPARVVLLRRQPAEPVMLQQHALCRTLCSRRIKQRRLQSPSRRVPVDRVPVRRLLIGHFPGCVILPAVRQRIRRVGRPGFTDHPVTDIVFVAGDNTIQTPLFRQMPIYAVDKPVQLTTFVIQTRQPVARVIFTPHGMAQRVSHHAHPTTGIILPAHRIIVSHPVAFRQPLCRPGQAGRPVLRTGNHF